MQKQVEAAHCGGFIIGCRRDPETGERGQLVQADWDYPSAASDLGWNMRRLQRRVRCIECEHQFRSGGCPCGGDVER
jgi:hypothetical protein